jgi:eukaryotic-like serine/threonine-protein kinase
METIGDYQLVRLLGEGGMGKVYEAEEALSKRRVALKILRPELARLESARKLFVNEMAVMAKLDHPNVVRALAFREIDDKLVMALELLDGRTLRGFLSSEERADASQAVSIVVQIARALCEAHENDPAIVHRDLKPENVMLLGDGTVKVMDFGIAKMLAAAGNTTTHSVGTLAYMSPEQIDAGDVDERSDLYCLGLVFYELLAGRPPFESQSPRELLNLQCTAEPPPLPDDVRSELPRGIERLLFQLLEKSPGDRPESARVVLETLENFAPAEPKSQGKSRKSSTPRLRPMKTLPSATVDEAPVARANDTVALLEQAMAPRDVPLRKALLIVLAASLFSAAVTWGVRSGTAPQRNESSFESRR